MRRGPTIGMILMYGLGLENTSGRSLAGTVYSDTSSTPSSETIIASSVYLCYFMSSTKILLIFEASVISLFF